MESKPDNRTREDEKEYTGRAISDHTLHLFESMAGKIDYNEALNADTEEERQEKFNELMGKLWKEVYVHGIEKVDSGTGEKRLMTFTDLDARSCLALLNSVGINPGVKYVHPGEAAPKGVTLDSGGKDGVFTDENGKILVVDHHGEESGRDTSATKHFYEALAEAGVFDKLSAKERNGMEFFVEFVTKCDNENYSKGEVKKVFDNYPRNLYGLRDKIDARKILQLFFDKPDRDPAEALHEHYLKNNNCSIGNKEARKKTLFECSEELEGAKDEAKKEIEELEKEGFILKTGDDREVLIDTKKDNGYPKVNRMANVGQLAARRRGFDGYLVWRPGEDGFRFYSYSERKISNEIVPKGMINVRGNYLTRDMSDDKPLDVTMKDFLKTLSGGEINPELERALEKEANERIGTDSVDAEKEEVPVEKNENADAAIGTSAHVEDVKETIEPNQEGIKGITKEDVNRLTGAVFGRDSIAGASPEEYLKEIESYLSTGGLINVEVEGESGWKIARVDSQSEMVIVEKLDEMGTKTVSKAVPFEKLMEWNESLFEQKLTPEELEACGVYEEGALKMVEYIKNMNWSELDYDPNDIPELIEINTRAYFRRLKREMIEEGCFENKRKVEMAIERILEQNSFDSEVFSENA